MEETVKAWAIVRKDHGLTWGDVQPINGDFGSGMASPNISTNRKWLKSWYLEEGEKIVRCTITLKTNQTL